MAVVIIAFFFNVAGSEDVLTQQANNNETVQFRE